MADDPPGRGFAGVRVQVAGPGRRRCGQRRIVRGVADRPEHLGQVGGRGRPAGGCVCTTAPTWGAPDAHLGVDGIFAVPLPSPSRTSHLLAGRGPGRPPHPQRADFGMPVAVGIPGRRVPPDEVALPSQGRIVDAVATGAGSPRS